MLLKVKNYGGSSAALSGKDSSIKITAELKVRFEESRRFCVDSQHKKPRAFRENGCPGPAGIGKEGPMYEGRWNRAKYLLAAVVMSVASFVIGFVIGAAGNEGAGAAIYMIVSLASFVIGSIFIVKRFHDLDRPGVHYWLLLIPLYNIYLGLVLLFQKGTTGPNKYGEDPLKQGE